MAIWSNIRRMRTTMTSGLRILDTFSAVFEKRRKRRLAWNLTQKMAVHVNRAATGMPEVVGEVFTVCAIGHSTTTGRPGPISERLNLGTNPLAS